MLNNLKIELLEKLNLIIEIAKRKLPSFPQELSAFIEKELDQKNVIITKEISENKFEILNGTSRKKYEAESITIKDYDVIKESLKYETDQIIKCEVSIDQLKSFHPSFIINIGGVKNFLFIFENETEPTDQEFKNLKTILVLIKTLLQIWISENQEINSVIPISSLRYFSNLSQSLLKEIKTNNGLLTLVQEERLSKNVENYFNEIKTQNSKVIKHFNQLNELVSIETEGLLQNENLLILNDLFESYHSKILKQIPNLKIDIEEIEEIELNYDRGILESLLLNISKFISQFLDDNKLKIITKIIDQQKLIIIFRGKLSKHSFENIINISDIIYESEDLKLSGILELLLAKRYLSLINGKLKYQYDDDGTEIHG